MLNDPLMLQGPLSPGSPLQNGNLKQMKILMNDWKLSDYLFAQNLSQTPMYVS
jgi:hypothetical protein